jgi:hypothetical protein
MKIAMGIALFAGGYVAAVFTWDRIHTFIVGAKEKALQLRDKARALEKAIKS